MALGPNSELIWAAASLIRVWPNGETLESQAQLGAHHQIAVAGRWQVGVII